MRTSALAVPISLALAVAGVAFALPGKDKVKLERGQKKGQRLVVKERERKESKLFWSKQGEGSGGGEEVEDVEREYVQELASAQPWIVKRAYRLSKRLKRHPKNPEAQPENTSVHGKTVVIGPDGPKIEGGAEMSDEDRQNLTTLERIVYACLPAKEVAPGEEWRVPGQDLARAIFGPIVDPTNFDSRGIAKLDKVTTAKDGTRTAKLALKVSIRVKPTEKLPAIDLDLKGQAQFAVEEGVFIAFDLEGPFRYEVQKREGGREASWRSEGTTRFAYKAEIVEPASTPAAGEPAKDQDLARAKQIACPAGHKFPVGYAFCCICGKKVDDATKLCPGGCPFILRHCPLCGGKTAPAE